MINYIKADMWRMERRLPRVIAIILMNIVMAGAIIYSSNQDSWNSVLYMDRLMFGVQMAGVACGILEFIAVFSEDFKAKTMQIAIGSGMQRRHVIVVKFVDFVLALIGDYLFLTLMGIVLAFVTQVHPNGEQMLDYGIKVLGYLLSQVGFYSLSLIFVFSLQSSLLPLITYVVLSCGLFHTLLNYLFKLKAVQPLNLDRFTLTYNSEMFISRLMVGSFKFSAFIAIAIYIAAGYFFSTLVFKNKELEF